MLTQVTTVCHKRYVAVLTTTITVCAMLLVYAFSTTKPQQQQQHLLALKKNTTMSFKELVVYDCFLYTMAILHALIQLAKSTRRVVENLHIVMVLVNVATYFLFAMLCSITLSILFIPDRFYVIRYGLPTLIFIFDWPKCVHVTKNLLRPRGHFSWHLVYSTSLLGFRLTNKTIFGLLFIVFGLYSDVHELAQLCLLTTVAMVSHCCTFVVLLPAITSLQHDLRILGRYCPCLFYIYADTVEQKAVLSFAEPLGDLGTNLPF